MNKYRMFLSHFKADLNYIEHIESYLKISDTGRERKYYHITESGRDRITAFKKEWEEILSVYRFINAEKGDKNE